MWLPGSTCSRNAGTLGRRKVKPQQHYSQTMKSSLHLSWFKVFVSILPLLMCSTSRNIFIPMGRLNHATEIQYACCAAIFTSTNRTRTLKHFSSFSFATAKYAILQILVHLVRYSIVWPGLYIEQYKVKLIMLIAKRNQTKFLSTLQPCLDGACNFLECKLIRKILYFDWCFCKSRVNISTDDYGF